MATLPQWSEKATSRAAHVDSDYVQSTTDLEFTVTGTEDDWLVKQITESNIPSIWDGLYLQNYEIEPLGGGIWDIVGHYGLSDPDESVFSFDTSGTTAHITHSKETVSSIKAGGGGAPNLGNAIGFDGDNIKGVDIAVPAFAFTEQHVIRKERLTPAYRAILFGLTATINNASFRGFAAGEVLFLGATGSRRGNNDAEITYIFEAAPNVTNFSIGGLTLPSKVGFNYVWIREKKQESGNRIVVQADAMYQERVYNYGDFSLLGIGTV